MNYQKRFGDYVDHYIPINDPEVYATAQLILEQMSTSQRQPVETPPAEAQSGHGRKILW